MTSHTPGPWDVYPGTRAGIDTKDGSFSIVVAGYDDDECGIWGRTNAEAEANARLIAAAPDLLEALSELLAEAEDIFVCMADATGIDRHRHPAPFKKARAAIAKATGGNNE